MTLKIKKPPKIVVKPPTKPYVKRYTDTGTGTKPVIPPKDTPFANKFDPKGTQVLTPPKIVLPNSPTTKAEQGFTIPAAQARKFERVVLPRGIVPNISGSSNYAGGFAYPPQVTEQSDMGGYGEVSLGEYKDIPTTTAIPQPFQLPGQVPSRAEVYYPGDPGVTNAAANLQEALALAKARREERRLARERLPITRAEQYAEDSNELKNILGAIAGFFTDGVYPLAETPITVHTAEGSPLVPPMTVPAEIPSTKPSIGKPYIPTAEEQAVIDALATSGYTADQLQKMGLSYADIRIGTFDGVDGVLISKETGLPLTQYQERTNPAFMIDRPLPAPTVETEAPAPTGEEGGGYYDGGGGGGGGEEGGGGGTPGEDNWRSGYDLPNAPNWWEGLVPAGEMTPEKEYATLMNALIPFMSPEDQRTTASTLAIMFPNIFGAYSATTEQFGGIPMPSEFLNTDYMRSFFSRKNAKNMIGALQLVANTVGGAKELGPGYHYLLQIASALRDFGGRRGELPTRAQLQQLRGALDPLVAMTGNQTLSAYGPLVNQITQPFFSAGEILPVTRLQDGSYQFGKANTELF